MNVIAKMRVSSIEDFGYSRKFKFTAAHDPGINIGDTPENRSFSNATPNGELWMTVDNKHVWPAFRTSSEGEPYGSQHYVLLIDAKEHSLEDVQRALASLEQ